MLTFTGYAYDPGLADSHSYAWDFGDGISATGSLTLAHSYAASGTYSVTLTVADDDGGLGVISYPVGIEPFGADFVGYLGVGLPPFTAIFYDTSAANVLQPSGQIRFGIHPGGLGAPRLGTLTRRGTWALDRRGMMILDADFMEMAADINRAYGKEIVLHGTHWQGMIHNAEGAVATANGKNYLRATVYVYGKNINGVTGFLGSGPGLDMYRQYRRLLHP